jgi:hypothetical protein
MGHNTIPISFEDTKARMHNKLICKSSKQFPVSYPIATFQKNIIMQSAKTYPVTHPIFSY